MFRNTFEEEMLIITKPKLSFKYFEYGDFILKLILKVSYIQMQPEEGSGGEWVKLASMCRLMATLVPVS